MQRLPIIKIRLNSKAVAITIRQLARIKDVEVGGADCSLVPRPLPGYEAKQTEELELAGAIGDRGSARARSSAQVM